VNEGAGEDDAIAGGKGTEAWREDKKVNEEKKVGEEKRDVGIKKGRKRRREGA